MTQVTLRSDRSMEWAIKKLKKKCEMEGLFEEIRKRRYFLTKRERGRLKHKLAVKRILKEKAKYGR